MKCCNFRIFSLFILFLVEKIPGQGVGRAVKHSDSCLEVDENTICEFIVSVLSEDESDSNSSSNDYSFYECDSSPVSERILLQSKPVNSKASDVDLNEQGVSDSGGCVTPDETRGIKQLFDWNGFEPRTIKNVQQFEYDKCLVIIPSKVFNRINVLVIVKTNFNEDTVLNLNLGSLQVEATPPNLQINV
ncbi:hypothetical protein L9F63_017351 [Diploptera punctata]|uniref:Uncharacterized protein n=1 Tax=Diploptera punctata TaxID=6984 RepID=A0AAD8A0X8_DIPPU|nr:hypothetical protein L9F63_017351 [Diploptera punctata]